MWVGPIPGRTSREGAVFSFLFLFSSCLLTLCLNVQLCGGDGGKGLGFPALAAGPRTAVRGPRWMGTEFGGEVQRREKPAAVVRCSWMNILCITPHVQLCNNLFFFP